MSGLPPPGMRHFRTTFSMRKLMVEFGLTPSSRSRIKVPDGGDAADEFDRFLEAG